MNRATEKRGAPGSDAEVVLSVPDMDCANCARRISSHLQGLNGVHAVDTRIVSKDLRVRFDPAILERGSIADQVSALGYTVDRAAEPGIERRREPGVWRSREARRTYLSGISLAAGLLLRLLGIEPTLWSAFTWTVDPAAVLFTLAALVGGLNFFAKGLRAARVVRLDMNFLMTVAIFGALAVGEFVEAGSIAFLFGIAELLERYSVERARRSIQALLELAPATARVIRGPDVVTVPVETLEPGDRVRVMPGEKVPIDGHVRDGVSGVDESPITGESMPATKGPGDYVYAGSMNREGYLEVEAAKRAGDTTLAHIIHLVEEAEASRSPSERFVDRFARHYTPAVTLLALALMLVPPLALGAPFSTWFVRGLTLLVISCPCALVISTPVAVVSAITSGARNGVLIKGGVHLETLGQVKAVAFDKTGTLTLGEPTVVDVVTTDDGLGPDQLLGLAAALEERSEHPIAQAIRRSAHERGARPTYVVDDFEALPGRGVRARLDGSRYRVGKPELFGESVRQWQVALDRLSESGLTPICVGDERAVLGVIGVADRERPDAREAIAALRRLGMERIVMLTGDHEATARAVAGRLGVDEYYAGLLPDEKVARIREIENRSGRVAMIGDGVNDAPALAAASVGIAMGAAASDAALETADVAVMAEELVSLPYLFRLSRRSGSVIKQNIVASIALKFSLAAGVLPGWVSLITAVLVGDMGASLAVTGNALRLARLKRTSSRDRGDQSRPPRPHGDPTWNRWPEARHDAASSSVTGP